MWPVLVTMLFLALAVSACSMTISKAKVFKSLRETVEERSIWLGGLLKCPYCTSHWLSVGAVVIYRPRPVDCGFLALDLAVAALAIVALAAFSSGLIFRAFAAMGPE